MFDKKPAFVVLNENSDRPCLLICEHASNYIPPEMNYLGLTAADFEKHYCYDIGVKTVTETVAEVLGLPAIMGGYSRLIVDCNRAEGSEGVVPTVAEGQDVPANIAMTDVEKENRLASIYRPYHAQIEKILDAYVARGVTPAVFSIHSFTPVFHGEERPWDIGFVWKQDKRMTQPMIDAYTAKGYNVGDNHPYDGRPVWGYAANRHGDLRLFPNALIAIRNDHIDTQEKAQKMGKELAEILETVLSDASLFTAYNGPRVEYNPELERAYMRDVVRTVASK